jgi:phosphatidylinositol alpha-1,6-mannosyltransferase
LLVLTPDYPPARGGIQHLLHRVVTALPAESTVVTRAASGADDWDARAGHIVVRPRRALAHRRTHLAVLNAVGIREAIRLRPDAILCGHVFTAPAGLVLRRVLNAPLALYLYADELPAHRWLTRLALRQSDLAIAISRYTAELALDLGARPDRLELVPPGVDLPPPRRVPRSSVPTLVTVARLEDRYKGHDVVLRALGRIRREVPGARWVVIGDGALRPELEQLARDLGVDDAVEFAGAVDDAERDRRLDEAHVFVMPSRLPPPGAGGEGFGIVYLEAALHELPVVAGQAGGAMDAVVDGETGLLVPDPADPVQVADAVLALLNDPDRAKRLGQAGAERARGYAWPNVARRVDAALRRVVAA